MPNANCLRFDAVVLGNCPRKEIRILQLRTTITFLLLISCSVVPGQAAIRKVTKAEATDWIRYTVPLPKSIGITDKAVVPKGSVAVSVVSGEGIVVEQAVKELYDVLGGAPKGQPSLAIRLEIGGKRAEMLRKFPNSEQAYVIYPAQDGSWIEVAALDPAGLYYGAKTIQQLVKPRSSGDKVEVPLLTVADWPDMQDRGLWGSDNFDHVRWMADRKMNWIEQISAHGLDESGRPFARLKEGRETLINEGPYYAMKPVPVVLHLEQSGHGVVEVFPELKAKSEHSGLMCYSKPKVIDIISDWILILGSLQGVQEVDVWMTENILGIGGCKCDDCKKTGVDPIVLEARAIVQAWELAKKKAGREIGLRVLTSETTEDFNKTIFAELPPEVKVVYYHSLLTYTSGRQPMLRPYLAEYAKSGRWLGVCPNLSDVPHFTQPFTSGQFVHYRMSEFVAKGLQGLLGYATPRVHFNRFNVEAAAEWGWNSKGRSVREFAHSWAVREGLENPAVYADYAEAVGAVLWDSLGSDWPTRADYGPVGTVVSQLRKNKLPDLGFVLWDFIRQPFGNIRDERQLDADQALADKAVRLARQMGVEEFVQESLIAQGYIRSLEALWEIKKAVKGNTVSPSDRASTQRYMQMYVDSLRQASEALPKWEKTVARPTDPPGFTEKPIRVMKEACIDEMLQYAKELGLKVR